MEKFLQWVGWIGISAVTVVLLAVTLQAGRGEYAILALVASMTWAIPAIVGFVLIAAFGSMLGQLKAIRAATERQAEAFQKIADRRPTA
jgi:O-antigen ligase